MDCVNFFTGTMERQKKPRWAVASDEIKGGRWWWQKIDPIWAGELEITDCCWRRGGETNSQAEKTEIGR